MVRSRVLEDEEVIKQRQELIRSKTPAELSQIHGLDDFPVPTFVEQSRDSLKKIRTRSTERYVFSKYQRYIIVVPTYV